MVIWGLSWLSLSIFVVMNLNVFLFLWWKCIWFSCLNEESSEWIWLGLCSVNVGCFERVIMDLNVLCWVEVVCRWNYLLIIKVLFCYVLKNFVKNFLCCGCELLIKYDNEVCVFDMLLEFLNWLVVILRNFFLLVVERYVSVVFLRCFWLIVFLVFL